MWSVEYRVSKLEDVSHEVLVWTLQHVSSGVSGFAVSLGEAAKPFVFQCVQVSNLEEVSHACFEVATFQFLGKTGRKT